MEKGLVFSERSLFDDALFWLVVSQRFGTNSFQQAAYEIVWRECINNITNALPDAFIYNQTPLKTCVERLAIRDRVEERGVVTNQEYLRKLISMHDQAFFLCTRAVDESKPRLRIFDEESIQKAPPHLAVFMKHMTGKRVFVADNNEPLWINEAIEAFQGFDDVKEICLSGCIAAGKSTSLEYIKEKTHHQTRPEPLDLWGNGFINLLEAFNTVPEKCAFEFQMVAFISRAFNRK